MKRDIWRRLALSPQMSIAHAGRTPGAGQGAPWTCSMPGGWLCRSIKNHVRTAFIAQYSPLEELRRRPEPCDWNKAMSATGFRLPISRFRNLFAPNDRNSSNTKSSFKSMCGSPAVCSTSPESISIPKQIRKSKTQSLSRMRMLLLCGRCRPALQPTTPWF